MEWGSPPPPELPRTSPGGEELHPILLRAAEGRLPEWARAGKLRRAHMERVARLLRRWATAQGLPEGDILRWTALGYLHDVLRESPPEQLRALLPPELRVLPPSVLHGPAGAVRLQEEGVRDQPFLRAVAYHTLGHPELCPMGRALYAADFLEPGRKLRPRWRSALRKRAPGELDEILREIVGSRIAHLTSRRSPIRWETLAFWNALLPSGERELR